MYESWTREELVTELERRDKEAYWQYQNNLGKNERGAGRKPKISSATIEDIQQLRKSGATYKEIAKLTEVSYGTAYNACQQSFFPVPQSPKSD